MEILQKGNLESRMKPIQFECDSCGCVFKATMGEYELASYWEEVHDNIKAKCVCPYCAKMVYAYN